jgi:acyl transferase domain-containing protein
MDFQSIKLDGFALDLAGDVEIEEAAVSDIAIIGIALKLPMADTVEEFSANLRKGVDCVRPLPSARKMEADRYFSHIGTDPGTVNYGEAAYLDEIDKFDYSFFKLSPKEASLLDPNQRLFLETSWNALEDAGYGGSRLEGSRTGVYVGYGSDPDYKKMIEHLEPDSIPMSMPGNVRPIIASRLSYIMDLKGPSLIVDTTCSSSLVAVHLACQAIRTGECDLAIAGGIQLHLLPVREFEVGVESSTSRTRTFDDASDGTGTGEGVVALVLKPLYKAQEDRDPIYAVIKSSAVNQDGSSVGITAPNSDAQAEVIAEAWRKAGIDPETIGYIETHGTGTKLGDPIELEGIQKAFRKFTDKKQFCAIGAVKSNIGHLDNAAGAAGLLKAVLSLKYKELFPTLHVSRPNRKISFEESPIYLNTRLARWEPVTGKRRCGVSAFGISGTNCHMVLEEAPEVESSRKEKDAVQTKAELFVLSAKSEAALDELARKYADYLDVHSSIGLGDLCYTANTGRGHYRYRLALVAGSIAELAEKLSALRSSGSGDSNAGSTVNSRSANDLAKEYVAGGRQNEMLLHELCLLYKNGADIKWDRLYRQQKRQRLNLPAYAFERKRCWLNISQPSPVANAGRSNSSNEDLYHQAVWEKRALSHDRMDGKRQNHRYLVIKDRDDGLGRQLSQKLSESGSTVIEAGYGDRFERVDAFNYSFRETAENYVRLFQELGEEPITRIVHLTSFAAEEESALLGNLERRLERSVYSLFRCAKALAGSGRTSPIELIIVTSHAEEVVPTQARVNPENAALLGLGKVIGWEQKAVRVRCIDIEAASDLGSVFTEMAANESEYKVAYRSGQRYVERIDKLDPAARKRLATPLQLKTEGVYVITGGLGGIGLHIAKLLASQKPIHLALINRIAFPQQAEWDDILHENADEQCCSRIVAIREMEQMGAHVTCMSADVADEAALQRTIDALKEQYGAINGVVHAAGIGEGDYLSRLPEERFKQIIAAKVQGTWLLDRLTQREQLDFLVLFSSAITLVGGIGSGPYTAANAYMDGYAAYRNRQGGRTFVINWPAWDNTGLSAGATIDEQAELFRILPVRQGVAAFEDMMNLDLRQLIVGEWNRECPLFELGDRLPFRLSEKLHNEITSGRGDQKPHTAVAPGAPPNRSLLKGKSGGDYTEIESKVAQSWVQVLGYDELDVHDSFFEIGGDSILITRVHAILEAKFPGKITVADLFSYTTIARISEFLQDSEEDEAVDAVDAVDGANASAQRNNDIAVIGLSVRMPDADNFEQFWTNIRSEGESIREYPLSRQQDSLGFILNFTNLREQEIKFSYGGYLDQVDRFDYGFFNLSPKEASLMDPNQRMFLEASWEAIEDAGYGGSKIVGSRTGVYLGYADWPVYGQYITKKHPSSIQMAGAGNTPSLIASRISYLLDLKGPAFLVDTACSSSLVAVHLACKALINDECEMAIAGGVKVCLMPVDGVFEIGIESSNRRTSAFDDDSDGTVWGEGTVALLLKPLTQAVQDRDRIYAVIKGSAINQDGASIGITAPNAPAQENVLVKAWEQAGIEPETITYIEAHGTGTKLGDPIEIDGIQRAFRRFTDKNQFCAIGSVKTNVGHLDSASGVAGLAKAIGALVHQELPPTLHFTRPNRKIAFERSPVYVNDRALKWETNGIPRRCGVSSFGFSGTNCHVVLEEAPELGASTAETSRRLRILTLSGKSKRALEASIDSYREYIRITDADLSDICYTSSTGRGHYSHRLAIVASDKADLLRKLDALARVAQGLDAGPPEGTFIGEHRIVSVHKEQMQSTEMTSAARRLLSEQASGVLQAMLRNGYDSGSAAVEPHELGRLYAAGADIDWEALYCCEMRRKVQVPTYPFQRSRCWTPREHELHSVDLQPSSYEQQSSLEGPLRVDRQAESVRLNGRADLDFHSLEETLGQIWGQLLGISEIDIYDDFFELGGNSLMVIELEVELEKFQLSITADDIYRFRCIKDLAAYLEGEEGHSQLQVQVNRAKPHRAEIQRQSEVYVDISAAGGDEAIILPRFEPFNAIFYKNCFYNSMFPVARHFGRSILPFLVNDIIVYEQEEGRYSAEYSPVQPIEEVFRHTGLQVDTRYDNGDIVNELIAALSEGKPAVLWVDSFYESIRKDAYRKQHIDHTLLVYGYNRKERLFHIIEHDRRENLSYKKQVISFEDVEAACTGFTENYVKQGDAATHFIFQPALAPSVFVDPVQRFSGNMAGSRDKIKASLNVLHRFIDTYRSLTGSEEALRDHSARMVDFINEAITVKQVEAFRLTKLLGDGGEALEALNAVIGSWEFVRKGMARFMYQPVYNPDVFAAGYGRLVELAAAEDRFNSLLFSRLDAGSMKIS